MQRVLAEQAKDRTINGTFFERLLQRIRSRIRAVVVDVDTCEVGGEDITSYDGYRFLGDNFVLGEGGKMLRRKLILRDDQRKYAHLGVIFLVLLGFGTNVGAVELRFLAAGEGSVTTKVLDAVTMLSTALAFLALYWYYSKEFAYQRAVESSTRNSKRVLRFVDSGEFKEFLRDVVLVAFIPIPGLDATFTVLTANFRIHMVLTAMSCVRLSWIFTYFAELSNLRCEQLRLLAASQNMKLTFKSVRKFLLKNDANVVGSMSVVFMLALAYCILIVERIEPRATVQKFENALWLTFITMTTVGYGDFYTVTLPGRLVTMCTSIGAIAVISFIVSLVNKSISLSSAEQDFFEHASSLHRNDVMRKLAGSIIISNWRESRAGCTQPTRRTFGRMMQRLKPSAKKAAVRKGLVDASSRDRKVSSEAVKVAPRSASIVLSACGLALRSNGSILSCAQVLLAQITGLGHAELAGLLRVLEVEVCEDGSPAIDRAQFEMLVLLYDPAKAAEEQTPSVRAVLEKMRQHDVSYALEPKHARDFCGLSPDAICSDREQIARRAKFEQLMDLKKTIVQEEEAEKEESILSAAASRLEAKMGKQYRALVRALGGQRTAHGNGDDSPVSDLLTPYSPASALTWASSKKQ
jgi:hypothetical protein